MKAREYFGSVRDAALAIERIEKKDIYLQKRFNQFSRFSSLKTQTYQAGSAGGATSDFTQSAALARISEELKINEKEYRRLKNYLEEANAFLYGGAYGGGLSKALGEKYADALCMRYVWGESWDNIAYFICPTSSKRYTRQWAQALVNKALREIDENGFAWAKNGGKPLDGDTLNR